MNTGDGVIGPSWLIETQHTGTLKLIGSCVSEYGAGGLRPTRYDTMEDEPDGGLLRYTEINEPLG
jgi:hypothetical protein